MIRNPPSTSSIGVELNQKLEHHTHVMLDMSAFLGLRLVDLPSVVLYASLDISYAYEMINVVFHCIIS